MAVSNSFEAVSAYRVGESRRNSLLCVKRPISLFHNTNAPLAGDRLFAMLSEFDTAFVSGTMDGISIPDNFGLPAPQQRGKK